MLEKLPFGSSIKSFLESYPSYKRIKYSEFGLWAWRQLARQQSRIIKREELFYRQLLNSLRSNQFPIFDIGANMGWLSSTFLEYSNQVIAVEPDTFCQEVLTYRHGRSNSFHLEPLAVSSEIGERTFLVQEKGSALNTFSLKWRDELEAGYFQDRWYFTDKKLQISTTTINELIIKYGLPALAKIDVEGHELAVFKGLSRPIPLVVFEANLPIFLEETKQIISKIVTISPNSKFNYADCFSIKMKEFMTAELFQSKLNKLGKCSIDIICRMENFEDYFNVE